MLPIKWQDGRAVKALASGASRVICVGVSFLQSSLLRLIVLTKKQSSPTLVNILLFAHEMDF